MSAKRRFLDVWIIEGNTVYKEVPFDVVADWVQQGRLLEDDMLRPSGTSEWSAPRRHERVRRLPAQAGRRAGSREPGRADGGGRNGLQLEAAVDDEDSEVDMIPLIDVSLVLLIFFMLTTNPETSAAGPQIPTPPAVYGSVVNAPDEVWVGINLTKSANGDPRSGLFSWRRRQAAEGAKPGDAPGTPGPVWRLCWRTRSTSI